MCRRSPTKNVGVPRAPLASALATSSRMRPVVRALVEVAHEPLDVEVELAGVADEVLDLELVLVLEQQVVHLPEAALGGGGLRAWAASSACAWTSVSGRWRKT